MARRKVVTELYKPMYTRWVVGVDSRIDGAGRPVTRRTPGARKIRVESETWWGRYPGPDGKIRRESLGTDDEQAADTLLRKLAEEAKACHMGGTAALHALRPLLCDRCRSLGVYGSLRDRKECDCSDPHATKFRRALLGEGCSAKHVRKTIGYVAEILEGCNFSKLEHLKREPAAELLLEWRRERPPLRGITDPKKKGKKRDGLSANGHNGYVEALKNFGNWLVRSSRLTSNPFQFLKKLNADLDRRRIRRAAGADEFSWLLKAAVAGG